MGGSTAGISIHKTMILEQWGRVAITGTFFPGCVRLLGNVQVLRSKIQRTAPAAAAETGLPAGKHDGANNDAAPNGTTYDDAKKYGAARANANDAAGANADNAATVGNDVDGTNTTHYAAAHGEAAAVGAQRPANTVAGPAISAVCRFWDGIKHGNHFW